MLIPNAVFILRPSLDRIYTEINTMPNEDPYLLMPNEDVRIQIYIAPRTHDPDVVLTKWSTHINFIIDVVLTRTEIVQFSAQTPDGLAGTTMIRGMIEVFVLVIAILVAT